MQKYTEIPTLEGYYWLYLVEVHRFTIAEVVLYEQPVLWRIAVGDEIYELGDGEYLLGPIPEPEIEI